MQSMRLHKFCTMLSICVLFMGTLTAQTPAAPQQPPPPTIRVNTRLVVVDVVVTDKQGKPIHGLGAADFTVEEKGKKQKIAVFTPSEEPKQAPPPQLGPGIVSNKPEFRSNGGPLTVLLLDAANTPFRDQAYAREQMLKYVKEQSQPGVRMGIFALTNSLTMLQDFTSDPQVLLKVLEKYRPQEQILGNATTPALAGGGGELRPLAGELFAQAESQVRSFQSQQVGYAIDRRIEITLNAMRSLARILGGIPGRKSIVWLTGAFPFELIPESSSVSEAELLESLPSVKQKGVGTNSAGSLASTQRQSHSQEIRDVAAQLSSAQVAIYPIDARGLMSGMEFLPEDSDSRQAVDSSGRAIARMSDAASSQETMRDMAAETGGKAYVNQNEIKQGVVLAMQDNAASYTVGYYPENKKWDGNYRSIKVKVERDGVEVRHRRGYFAIDPSTEKNRKPEEQVAEALRDNAPDTQVSFSARVKPTDTGKLGIDFLVDANTVSAEDASGGKKLNVVFYAVVFSPEGKMLENRSMKVDQTFKDDVYQQIMQHGILLHMDLDPHAGKNQLHLAVQDNRTGLVGTLTTPLGQ